MRSLSLMGMVFGLLLLLTGCGNKVYPVRGEVVFDDGTPGNELAGYLIQFQSLEHKMSAGGIIQSDGTFTVGTNTDTDGAMLGKQRVAIMRPAFEEGKPRLAVVIPPHYGNFDTSGLELDIKPQKNQVTITVARLKK